MNTPRFGPGRLGPFDGIDFRISKGNKKPNNHDAVVGAAHPDGDLVIEWMTPNKGWVKVTCQPIFLLIDFIAWNEDFLFQRDRDEGGELILNYMRTAREIGYADAWQKLEDARNSKNGTPTTHCQFCQRKHDVPDDLCEWDWAGIRAMERAAKAKGARMPKCQVCGQPMWLGQVGTHHSCKET